MKTFSLRHAWFVALGIISLTASAEPLAVPSPDVAAWEQLMNGSARSLKSNHLDEAIAQCEKAMTTAAGFGQHDTHVARSQVLRAEIYLWQKQNDRAEAMFHSAVATCEAAVGPNDPEMVHPLTSLANYYYYVAVRYSEVAALFERILAVVEKAPAHDEHQAIMWRRNLGMIYQQMGKFEQAEPLFVQAVAGAEKTDPSWVPHELLTQADFYRAWKKFPQAEEAAKRAVTIRESVLAAAPDNVDAKLDLAVSLDGLGAVYVDSKRGEEATKLCRRSLALVETFMAADQPDLVPRLLGLAEALRVNGKFEESDGLFRRALVVTEKNLGAASKEYVAVLKMYAVLLREAGRPDGVTVTEARIAELQKTLGAPGS